MESLYDAPNISVQFDAASGWLYARWFGKQLPTDIRKGGRAMVAAMREVSSRYACSQVLNDNREVVGSWSHSLEWSAKEWFPSMLRAGLKQFAWVLSPDGVAQLTAVRVKAEAGPLADGTVTVFSDIDAARAWLLSHRPR